MGARPGEAAPAFCGMVREREHGDLGGVTDGTWRSWSVSAGVWCRSVKPASAIGSRRWPSALTSTRELVLRNHPNGLIHRRGFADLGTTHLGADALERHAGG